MSISRWMFCRTSRRRSPSTTYCLSMISRSRFSSSSVRSRTRVVGLTRAPSTIFFELLGPIPYRYRSEISTGLSRGMSTPEIRAMLLYPPSGNDLSLPLLMLRHFTDDPQHAVAADHLALVAAGLYRCPHFHITILLADRAKER